MSTSNRNPRSLAVWVAILLASMLAPTLRAEDWNAPNPNWYEGPARYLLTHEEVKAFRSLKTAEERSRFIEDFWARRDQEPGTPLNEDLIRFERRLADANRLFRDAPHPGWLTDRGKLYVLLGGPDEIQQGTAFGRRGKEVQYQIWIYHEPRFEGMMRDTELRFVQDSSGEFTLSDRLFMNRLEIASATPRLLALRALDAQRPPEPRDLLDAVAAREPKLDEKRFRTHYDFFKARDGSTSVFVTLGVRGREGELPDPEAPSEAPNSAWKVFARLAGSTGSYDLVDGSSFRTGSGLGPVDGFHLYQGRISVPSDEYTVFFAVRDPHQEKLFSLGERIQVPDFGGALLSMSGIILASRIQEAATPTQETPFHIGRYLVVPKIQPEFPAGGEMGFYFQVYNPLGQEGTGQLQLDLTYQFYLATRLRKTGELSYSPFGEAIRLENQSRQVFGLTFPLTGWSPGEYQLRIRVVDRMAESTVETSTDFSIK